MTVSRIIAFILVLIAFTMWPLVLLHSSAAAALLAVVISVWILWSVMTYLRWARALGRTKDVQSKIDRR